jgi:hypothetical protein
MILYSRTKIAEDIDGNLTDLKTLTPIKKKETNFNKFLKGIR